VNRVSVTELETFQRCEVLHDFKYTQRLRRIEAAGGPVYMQAGKLIAEALEYAFLVGTEGSRRTAARQFALDRVVAGELSDRCLKAINSVPNHIWQLSKPVSEDKLEVQYENGIELVGIPDLWYVHDDGVRVLEFKAPSKDKRAAARAMKDYELWSQQPTRYAVLLHDKYEWLQGMPFYKQHVMLSQHGFCLEGEQWRISPELLDNTRSEMLSTAAQVGSMTAWKEPVHAYMMEFGNLPCIRCDFSDVCTAHLTNGDESDIIRRQFRKEAR
jgi:hypothetical protein